MRKNRFGPAFDSSIYSGMDYADTRKDVRKWVPYSIEVIGSREDYAKWQEYQEQESRQRLLESETKAALRRNKAVDKFMAPPMPLTGVSFALDGTLVDLSTGREWGSPRASKRLIDHFKTFCSNIWNNAFDSER